MTKPQALRVIEQVDRVLADEVACVRETSTVRLMGAASEIADQPQLSTLTLSVLAFGLAARDARLARAGLRMFASFALATALKTVVKKSVDRTRPFYAEIAGYAAGRAEHVEGHWNSFPSGHTAGALAVAEALGREYPRARLPAIGVAAGIAGIQVPRGKHYLTDLLAGAIVGWASEAAVNQLVRLAPRRPA